MKFARLLLACLLGLALSSCAGLTAHQKIAVSCESAASALDAVVAAKVASKVSVDQMNDAIRVYEASVVPVCIPVAENLSAVQQAALAAVIIELQRRAGGSP